MVRLILTVQVAVHFFLFKFWEEPQCPINCIIGQEVNFVTDSRDYSAVTIISDKLINFILTATFYDTRYNSLVGFLKVHCFDVKIPKKYSVKIWNVVIFFS